MVARSERRRSVLMIPGQVAKVRLGRVTVGTDGSYWGHAALDWAVRYAHRAGLELDVYEADRRFEDIPADLPADIGTGSVLRSYPMLPVRVRSSGDDPAAALLAAAKTSGLVVVGCRGQHKCHLGVGRHALLLAESAPCDVVVVRGRPQAVHGEFRKVTAWLDADDDEPLVARARQFAKLTRSVLEVVRRDAAATVPDATDLVVTRPGPGGRAALHHATCPVHIVR
ncbi:universal stress protein [Kutzneria sp. NPDC052558]|uniref:universal stress protein n=1 Tax=Kutzneria sp. NPDC052558 TaxID=3364121 RepID=UPI0037CAB4B9